MKAPNKLYVSQLIYETWQYQTPDPDDETQVEYIRKDALLEWIDEYKNYSSGPSWELLKTHIETI